MLAVGCVVAFGMSLAAIRFLMDYVKRHDFKFFGAYRIVLASSCWQWRLRRQSSDFKRKNYFYNLRPRKICGFFGVVFSGEGS